MNRRQRGPAFQLLLLCLAAACASPAAPSHPGNGRPAESAAAPVAAPATIASEAPPPPATVRIGLHTPMSNAGFFVAIEQGYVAEQGITFEIEPMDTAAKMIAPLSNGQLDVGTGTISAGVYNAVARGVDLRLVADKGTVAPGFGYEALIVRRDLWDSGAVRTPADLRGRTMAVLVPGGDAELGLDTALRPLGSSSTEVNVVAMPFPEMIVGLANGAIDAAGPTEPFVTEIVERGYGTILQRLDEILPNHQVAVVFYAPQFVRDNPDAARRLMVAYLKGVRDYNDAFGRRDAAKREAVIAALIKHTPVTDRALYDKMAVPGLDPNGLINADSLRHQQEWNVERGLQTALVDVDSLIDYQFVHYAVEQLGEYR